MTLWQLALPAAGIKVRRTCCIPSDNAEYWTNGQGLEVLVLSKMKIREAAVKAYQEEYPEMNDVRSTEVVMRAFGGNLAVVEAKTEEGIPESEVTFVDDNLNATLFATTKELVRFLQGANRTSIVERLSGRSNLAAIICVLALFGVFAIGFTREFRSDSLAIIGSLVGGAAGFLFGSGRAPT